MNAALETQGGVPAGADRGALPPTVDSGTTPAPIDLSAWQIPAHFLLECRALTAAIVAERGQRLSCSVSLTGTRTGVGVTTIAWCLARYLARGTGAPVVLVQTARPDEDNDGGLAVRPTTDPGLAYVKADLATMGQDDSLSRLMTRLRASYPYVVVDLPAVLSPSFSEAVVRLSDAVMLVVEPDVDTVAAVQKASSILRPMTTLLGVVFNRADGG